ncbi:hypothetical protein J437_LFUL018790 [Ladona fulva]|uniref:Uncharacterized protein n=1 Tax=Ladona fulva TaxID=123851 RepID=A0A8K0KSX7_LADFU|nr:hypothetical protein J437_LFUL018790 [Ladona fulva]
MEGKDKGKNFTKLSEYEELMRENIYEKYRILNITFGRLTSVTEDNIKVEKRKYLDENKENDDNIQDPCCSKGVFPLRKGVRQAENKGEADTSPQRQILKGEFSQDKNLRYPKRQICEAFYVEEDIPSDDDYICNQ